MEWALCATFSINTHNTTVGKSTNGKKPSNVSPCVHVALLFLHTDKHKIKIIDFSDNDLIIPSIGLFEYLPHLPLAKMKLFTGVCALLCLHRGAAYDDSDFVRDWNNQRRNDHEVGKTRNLIDASRNMFKIPMDKGVVVETQLEPEVGTNMFDGEFTAPAAAAGGDITPFIVGGTIVDPPRKYKVRVRMKLF